MAEHKHAEVLRAIADGKPVQWANENSEDWVDAAFKLFTPISNPNLNWRVKPEPKPDYCLYAGYHSEISYGSLYSSPPYNWQYTIKITIDGETNEPKSVELVK